MEAAGGGEDEGARGVEAGAAKTRWHGAEDGGAPVSGLAGSSSKAAGAWRRRSSGGARGRRQSRRRDGRRRRRGADQECPSVGGRRRLRDIYRGPLLSRMKPRPGTKDSFVPGRGFTRDKRGGLLSRVNPPPGTKGPFVPGRGSTRDKRCFWAGRENSQPAAHL